MDELLAQWVDLDETRINGTIESAKFGHETDITLLDGLVWIRTDEAARNGA